MKTIRFVLTMFALALCGTAAAEAQCVSGGLVAVVNGSNSADNLSAPQLRRLMLGDVRSWPGGKPVMVINRDAGSDVYRCVLQQVLRMSDGEYRKYLMSAEFRGEEPVPVRAADSAATAVRLVSGSGGGITLMEGSLAAKLPAGVKVLKINGRTPGESGYPF